MLTTIMLAGLPVLLPTFIAGLIAPDSANTVMEAMAKLFLPFYMAIEAIIDLIP